MLTTMMKIAAAFAVAAGAVLPSHADEIAVPSVVTGDAIFWLDASDVSTITTNTSGEVTQWNSRVGSNYAKQGWNYYAGSAFLYPTYNATTYGIPTVDFGNAVQSGWDNSNPGRDLNINTPVVVKTVFFVTRIQKDGKAAWLGQEDAAAGTGNCFRRDEYGAYNDKRSGQPGQSRFANFWIGTNVVADMTTEHPPADRFCVYSAQMDDAGTYAAQHLAEQCGGLHSGGKQLSELILFDRVLTDEERIAVTRYPEAKWHYEPTLMDTAVLWLDASATGTITTNASGEVTRWNSRVGSNYARQSRHYNGSSMPYPKYDTMTWGIPTVDFGEAKTDNGWSGSNLGMDLWLSTVVSVRTVFWVAKMGDGGNVAWMGTWAFDTPFRRGGDGQYAMLPNAKFTDFWNGTDVVTDMATEHPPSDRFCVFSAQMDDGGPYNAEFLASHCLGLHSGGKQLSELIIFDRVLTDDERLEVTYYLTDKWMSEYEAEGMKWDRRHADSAGDDGEWGADKYRVFGADAQVPPQGAAAWGVELTAGATLGGGVLALGHGGIYAASGATVTVTNAVTGGVNVFGPGTVKFLAQGTMLDALTVGGTARAVLLPGTTIGGKLIMRDNGRLVIDATSLPAGEYGEISVGSYSLPTGGSLLDYVEVLGTGHRLTYDITTGTLMLNEGGIPVEARWMPQNGSTNPKDAANWRCLDAEGFQTAGKLPGKSVTKVTLATADLDLRDWGVDVFADGVEIDLKGHSLRVDNLDGVSYTNAVIKNTSAATATLEVRVTADSVNNPSATISGNVRFVKSGEGEFVASRAQSYTGGTEVRAGTLKAGIAGTGNPLGATGTELKIDGGATFELNGKGGWGGYGLTLAGGTLRNSTWMNFDAGLFTNVTLTAESLISMPVYAQWGLAGANYDPVTICLDGHTLNMDVYRVDISIAFCNARFVGGGDFHIRSGGNFQTGVKGIDAACGEIAATNVSLRVNSALKLYATLSVRDYEPMYNTPGCVSYDSTAEMRVFGAFKPASFNVFYGCTMQDGSTIDLANRTGAGGLPFHTTSDVAADSTNSLRKAVGFAPGATVTVDLSAFTAARGEAFLKERANPSRYGFEGDPRILTWDAPPPADVEFVLDAETSASFGGKYRFKRRADGLFITRNIGTSIHLR